MTESDVCEKRVRPLYDWEIIEARKVFANELDYAPIRIHECAPFANRLDDFGRRIKGMDPRPAHVNNALTLGNHPFYPLQLPTELIPVGQKGHYFMPWLIHELTHCYQFQHMGWRYILLAFGAQIRLGAKAYEYGDWQDLVMLRQKGWKFHTFNLEQQGDITRDYYAQLVKGEPVDAWWPYIQDIQKGYKGIWQPEAGDNVSE